MKQYKLIKAYKATESLSHNDKLSTATLWGIYSLRKKLFPHWEFQTEREEDLKKKYSAYADENGNLTGEHYKEFINELSEVAEMEKEVDTDNPIEFVLEDGIGITVETMEALDPFVRFVRKQNERSE